MKALAIAATELRRLVRWRANLFFLFILPMLIILLLGAAFGGASARIGVVGGDSRLGGDLVRTMDAQKNVAVSSYAAAAELERRRRAGAHRRRHRAPRGRGRRAAGGRDGADSLRRTTRFVGDRSAGDGRGSRRRAGEHRARGRPAPADTGDQLRPRAGQGRVERRLRPARDLVRWSSRTAIPTPSRPGSSKKARARSSSSSSS